MRRKLMLYFIGAFAIFTGVAMLYQSITGFFTTSSPSLMATISSIGLASIAILGGFEAIKLTPNGRKLLNIYFMFYLWGILLFLGGLIFTWAKTGGNLSIESSQLSSALIYLSYSAFSVISLIFLLSKDNANVFRESTDLRQKEMIGKALSLLTPGLGRAFLGNMWAGFILFLIYSSAIAGKFYLQINSIRSFPLDSPWFGMLFDIVIWMIFAWVDWQFVKNANFNIDQPLSE